MKTHRNVKQMKQTSGSYTEMEWIKSDSADLAPSDAPDVVATPLRGVEGETDHRPVATSLILTDPTELNLAKRLCQFAEIVPQVLNDFRPNILANYLFELANSFHAFYEACPVLKSEEPARSSRLALCDLTGRILKQGLGLLGIKVPERM